MKTMEPSAREEVSQSDQTHTSMRTDCQGMPPLTARLEPWMTAPGTISQLHHLVQEHGSPLNLIHTDPFLRNIDALYQVAESHQVDFDVYFARKANKCLAFIDAAHSRGFGIDTASENELHQVLKHQVPSEKIICTAAVKSEALLQACIVSGTTLAIDNPDELSRTALLSARLDRQAEIALRISGFQHDGHKLPSRFGFDIEKIVPLLRDLQQSAPNTLQTLNLTGVHFHLDGYSQAQRISALRQLLPLVDQLRDMQFPIRFIDIGGGFPMSYLDSETEWNEFWMIHKQALLDRQEPLTWQNHGLGLQRVEDRLIGKPHCYPYYQSLVQADWFNGILSAQYETGIIASALQERTLQLRCEPGRSILDGCGITAARVESRKQQPNGDWLIGLSMNRTQCRTSSDDFLVDPLLVPAMDESPLPRTPPGTSGFLTGAYCTESELLCLRKLQFTRGVGIGDLILFPNTAGYFMHFLESRSHQFPLAKNLVYHPQTGEYHLDAIEAP